MTGEQPAGAPRLIPDGITRSPRTMNRGGSEEGTAMLQFALTLPVLLSFVFGFMQVCIAMSTRAMLAEIAREGTRYAMVRGATCVTSGGASCTVAASDVNSYLSNINWPNLGGGPITVKTTYPDGNENAGSRVRETVSYVFAFNVPFVWKQSLTMSSTSVMYIVQ